MKNIFENLGLPPSPSLEDYLKPSQHLVLSDLGYFYAKIALILPYEFCYTQSIMMGSGADGQFLNVG